MKKGPWLLKTTQVYKDYNKQYKIVRIPDPYQINSIMESKVGFFPGSPVQSD